MKWTPPANWEDWSPQQFAEFAWSVPCALVHAAGAECAKCNPKVSDGGYSASPAYLEQRLAVARKLASSILS